jgi:hypothetical protein
MSAEQIALTPEQIAEGWLPHDGGPCPVPLDSMQCMLTPLGVALPEQYGPTPKLARSGQWEWDGTLPKFLCVIAYKPESPDHD